MLRVISTGKIIPYILIIIFLGLASFIFLHFKLYSSSLILANEFYSGIKKNLNPSKANLNLKSKDLTISFKISSEDQISLNALSKSLRIDNLNDQNIKIKLGDETADLVNKILKENNLVVNGDESVDIYLRFLPKGVNFDNKMTFGPFNYQTEDLLENPSLEGSIKILPQGKNGYFITIDNPENVISEATSSGKLKLSEELTSSEEWQLLSKLATIKLKIDNDLINGSITLK